MKNFILFMFILYDIIVEVVALLVRVILKNLTSIELHIIANKLILLAAVLHLKSVLPGDGIQKSNPCAGGFLVWFSTFHTGRVSRADPISAASSA